MKSTTRFSKFVNKVRDKGKIWYPYAIGSYPYAMSILAMDVIQVPTSVDIAKMLYVSEKLSL